MNIIKKILEQLYKMLEDNEGGSLSNTRVIAFTSAITGIILLILYFFGIGSNPEPAYTLIGVGVGSGTIKSVSSQNKTITNNTITTNNKKKK